MSGLEFLLAPLIGGVIHGGFQLYNQHQRHKAALLATAAKSKKATDRKQKQTAVKPNSKPKPAVKTKKPAPKDPAKTKMQTKAPPSNPSQPKTKASKPKVSMPKDPAKKKNKKKQK